MAEEKFKIEKYLDNDFCRMLLENEWEIFPIDSACESSDMDFSNDGKNMYGREYRSMIIGDSDSEGGRSIAEILTDEGIETDLMVTEIFMEGFRLLREKYLKEAAHD
jgi:hypothetical protein